MKKKPSPKALTASLRHRAEDRVMEIRTAQPEGSAESHSESDIRRLLHELQVHQVELEMQNAELRLARDELETALENYTDLYDFAPVGYFTITAAGVIRMVNLTGAGLAETPRSKLIGKPFRQILAQSCRQAFDVFLIKVLTGETARSADFGWQGSDRSPRMVNIAARCLPGGGECRAAVVDITARRSIEQELAEKARLLDLSHDAIIVRDQEGRIRYWNHGAEELYGWSREEAVGKISHHLLQTEFRVCPEEIAGELDRTERWIGELVHVKRDGARVTVLVRKTLDRGSDGRAAAVMENITDITGRKQAEAVQHRLEVVTASNRKLELEISRRRKVEQSLKQSEKEQSLLLEQSRQQQRQLRGISHKILQAQEEERKRISRELHDVIAQTLVGINLHVAALSKGDAGNPVEFQKKIDRTRQLVEQSVDTVHQFARELRPTVLDDLGLIPALQACMGSFMEKTGVHGGLETFAEVEQCPEQVRTVIYRVVQEALTNIARHAGATRVDVSIQDRDGALSLLVQDNGTGFDTSASPDFRISQRLGLLGMRERVEMIGGNFKISSAPGQPTTVRADFPRPPMAEKKQRIVKPGRGKLS